MELRDQLQQTFAGAYTIERELGGGGMSRVFVAMDNALGRRVVVKVLPTDMGGVVSLDRFRREIGIAARLQHAHLVPVLSSGEVDGTPYFLMPYIDGESLRTHLERHGELPLSDAVRILREVATALAYAHAQGVVHRDIKPDNVLLSSGAAMVTDFGVARALSDSANLGGSGLTSVGVSLGTPAYMAPEQVSADPHVDARADVYAWGTMAYEMLTGQPPFAGRSPQALLAAQVVEAPEPITRRRPSIPPALAALVMRSLEKRAADRPQTADELVRSLDAISITGAVHTGTPRRASSTVRRVRVRAIGLAIAALLAVVIGGAVWMTRTRGATAGIQSIAVIPVSTASDTSDYFSDGIIETLIAALTKVPGLEVRSSTSSLSLRGRHLSDAQIGELLHVRNVLHVSVRRSPPRMRVIVDLARVSDGTVLWADQQERPLGEVFAAQDSIASHTANALAIHLGAGDRARVSSFGTENLKAYDLYLQGRHAMTSFDEPSLRHAIALFDSALAKDPRYSLALSSQAECWVNLSDDWLAPRVGYAKAEAAARKAVELDSLNWGAIGMLAVAHVTLDRDYAGALRETERAFRRDSLHANSSFSYAALLAYSGQLDSSAVLSRRAVALDPINPVFQLVSGWTEFYNGHFDKSIAHYREALALVPTLPPAWNGMAESTLDAGRPAEALQMLAHGTEQMDAHRSTLARTLAALGRTHEAKAVTASLVADAERRYVSGDYIAAAYIAQGDRDEALRWLERANDERSQWVLTARSDPRWQPLHGTPRFTALVAQIGGANALAR